MDQHDFLIFPILVRDIKGYYYEIFAVRIEDLGRPTTTTDLLRPKIVLRCSKFFHKLCIVGSTVYLFSEEKAVGTLDISFFLSSSKEVVLRDGMIRYISPMKCGKRNVEAVPTPDKKVIAFSRSISLGSSFELYDPDTEVWEDVPDFPPKYFKEIKSYYFTDANTFVVQNPSGETYQLILGCPANTSLWQDGGLSGGPSSFCGFSHGIVGSDFELCLSGNVLWDIRNAGGVHKPVYRFPFSSFLHPFESQSLMIISGGRLSCYYVLEIAIKSGEWYLSIQEGRMELAEYFKEKKALEAEFHHRLETLEKGSLEHKHLGNETKLTSPDLVCFPLRSSTFLLCPESRIISHRIISHSLIDETTFAT